MSWAAHDIENYVIQKHLGTRVAFFAVVLGAFLPDLFTKAWVYGVSVGGWSVSGGGAQFQRGWPGAGFTHSLLFGVAIGALVLVVFHNRAWALGIVIGQWAHAITDINDTAGTMLFFPFSTYQVSTGMWRYGAETGKYGDAAAYFSSLGLVWDALWLIIGAAHYRVLSARYFEEVVLEADARVWDALRRRLHLSTAGLLVLYRGIFFYGATRVAAWTIWVHTVNGSPWSLEWGGPSWIEEVDLTPEPWTVVAADLAIGFVLCSLTLILAWRLFLRRAWCRAGPTSGGQSLPRRANRGHHRGWQASHA